MYNSDLDEMDGDAVTEKDFRENEEEQIAYSGLVLEIRERFDRAKLARHSVEERWLNAYRNYRGEYDGTTLAAIPEGKSKVFVKITKTKVLAAFGQLKDVLFANHTFPIGVEPTPEPEGISEYAHLEPQTTQAPTASPYGFPGDGNDLAPGATASTLQLGELEEKYGSAGFKNGPSPDPKTMPQIEPAAEAARNMEKRIHDQLESSNASTVLSAQAFECALLGTGVMKGPFTVEKMIHKWKKSKENGNIEYEPYKKLAPRVEHVSVWNFYPDPSAKCMEDCGWTVERHLLNEQQLRSLEKQPHFIREAIAECIKQGPNYTPESYETYLTDAEAVTALHERFEVLEFWGIVDRTLIVEAGLEDELGDEDEFHELMQVPVNVWVCNNQILRLIANPFIPSRLPYLVCPYESDPYRIFGVGVAENMDDSQQILNGLARMTIDNLTLSGNIILDVDENSLVSGQDFALFPGKIFRRNNGMPGQAIHAIEFPNTTQESMNVFDRFRQLVDEQTGIPSYSHGQTGVSGMTRTSSGMSMLMGASALNIKTVVKNIDDYLLKPLGEAMFAWNMQFSDDESLPVRGDLEIRARGTSALMQKEVRSQRLLTFLNLAANPQIAPFVKIHTILKEAAQTLDIDPEKIINDPEQAAIYARIIGLQNPTGAGDASGFGGVSGAGGMGTSAQVPAGANASDPSGVGGGNIGTGSAPAAGESAFTGNSVSPAR